MKKIARTKAPVQTAPEPPRPSGVTVGGGVKAVGLQIQVFRADGSLKASQTGKTVQEV